MNLLEVARACDSSIQTWRNAQVDLLVPVELHLNSILLPVITPLPTVVQYTLGITIENIGTGFLCVYNLCLYIINACSYYMPHINYKMLP